MPSDQEKAAARVTARTVFNFSLPEVSGPNTIKWCRNITQLDVFIPALLYPQKKRGWSNILGIGQQAAGTQSSDVR